MNRYPALAASPLSAIAPVEPVLNVTDIQGNIVAGFNKDYQTFLFLRMVHPKKPKPVRKWIRGVLAPQRLGLRGWIKPHRRELEIFAS